jgi:hypothetical protein
LRVWARPLPRFASRRAGALRVERFTFAGDAAAGWPNHIVRDAEYLNWRYLDSPRDYVAYDVDGGYAVLGHKRHKGHPIALVADLVGPVRVSRARSQGRARCSRYPELDRRRRMCRAASCRRR